MNNILSQLVLLFGLMAIGFICKKGKVLDGNSDKNISKFLVNVTIPATIISSSIGQSIENRMQVMVVLLLAAAVFIITPLFSHFFVHRLKLDNTYKLMLNYSNLGFMGIPIVSSIYGNKAVFDVSIFMMVFNISLFSYGVSVLQEHKQSWDFKKMINPGILSAFCAIGIFMFDLPIASPIANLISSVGSITTPLAMIIIGSTIGTVNLKDVFQDKTIYLYTLLKLVVYPAVLWVILHFFIHNSMILGITVILSSLPTAGNVSMLCLEYNGNIQLVTKGTFMTTLCSIFTIPILMYLF
ncbi:AEC family transporter [Pullulanibacillus sp. KACC 23026]|uniref:AEC family transporter n=1 Tax=Pullulanibacillus sp. KACC 23026 TaxID=3028315 RepID=UPI0023AE80B7|nr:AEC family transporter [Pullulanibacillus sp. KACC 23026]WEG12459.1 AEC family transporter [Pullulanibacillus sp. KACC 23026]